MTKQTELSYTEKALAAKDRKFKNKLAQSLMPIAANQARILSYSSGISYDLLFAEAQLGISIAVARGEVTRPGFWRYAKFCIRGYMLNYLRDHSRSVRTPRDLSVLYLAEQALIKRRPDLRHAGDQARAELLNVTTEKLAEARMAVNFYSSDVANHDRCDNNLTLTDEDHDEQMLYDLAFEVISAGLQVVASKAKVPKTEVSDRFHKAMALLSERGML